jgi:hypothetical protein
LPGGVSRVYWHQFCARVAREWNSSPGTHGMWCLPRTANENDHLLQVPHSPDDRHAGLIAIHANAIVTYECLADMCQMEGWSTVWLPPRQPMQLERPTILLWDAVDGGAAEFAAWRARHLQLRPRASVVLMAFPRSQDVQSFIRAGAKSVLAKPFLVADLLHTFGHVVSGSRQRRAG